MQRGRWITLTVLSDPAQSAHCLFALLAEPRRLLAVQDVGAGRQAQILEDGRSVANGADHAAVLVDGRGDSLQVGGRREVDAGRVAAAAKTITTRQGRAEVSKALLRPSCC